jgi:hypothetical protein
VVLAVGLTVKEPVADTAPMPLSISTVAAFVTVQPSSVDCPGVIADGLAEKAMTGASGTLPMVNVAVSTSLPPAASVTACVIVWLPLATAATFQASAAEFAALLTLPM